MLWTEHFLIFEIDPPQIAYFLGFYCKGGLHQKKQMGERKGDKGKYIEKCY